MIEISPEIEKIYDFIQQRSGKTLFARWTREQLVILILEQIRDNHIRIAYDTNRDILGVIFFNPIDSRGEFFVEQLWLRNKIGMILLLMALIKEFPSVKEVTGFRQKTRKMVRYNLKTLVKIYGK